MIKYKTIVIPLEQTQTFDNELSKYTSLSEGNKRVWSIMTIRATPTHLVAVLSKLE